LIVLRSLFFQITPRCLRSRCKPVLYKELPLTPPLSRAREHSVPFSTIKLPNAGVPRHRACLLSSPTGVYPLAKPTPPPPPSHRPRSCCVPLTLVASGLESLFCFTPTVPTTPTHLSLGASPRDDHHPLWFSPPPPAQASDPPDFVFNVLPVPPSAGSFVFCLSGLRTFSVISYDRLWTWLLGDRLALL